MQIAQRANKLPESPIRKLVPLAEAARQKGVEVLPLNIGQPDIETPAVFWQAVEQSRRKVLAYEHSAGMKDLRAALANNYAQFGAELTFEDVLITHGGSEAVQFALQVCLDAGDTLLAFEPFYANYRTLAQQLGVEVLGMPTLLPSNFQLPPLAEIEASLSPGVKAILISNPDNPTGKVYTEAELRQLLDLAVKHDLWLIVDEVYRDFCYGAAQFHSILQIATGQELERVIVIDSISKRYSACGARVGALISKNKTVQAAALKCAQARLAVGTIDQLGALALYQADLQSYLAEVRAEYAKRQQILLVGLRGIPGVVVPEVSGAFYLLLDLPVASAEAFAKWLLTDFYYQTETGEKYTVMLAPAQDFYTDPKRGLSQVRIAYVLEQEKLQLAVQVLAAGLMKYQAIEA